jgi:hypothetical protein
VLVISLTVIEYFSKRVVNDVIKLEVSTGVGIFFGRAAAKPGQKSDIESFLKSYIQAIYIQTYWHIVVDRYL